MKLNKKQEAFERDIKREIKREGREGEGERE